VVHPWSGELYKVLSALAVGEQPPAGRLGELAPLRRLRPH
jgi:hypothetical protein